MTTLAALQPKMVAPLLAADGTPLAKRLRIASRRARWRAFLYVAPLLIFVVLMFVVPIIKMLRLSIHEPTIAQEMPGLAVSLAAWNGLGVPDEPVFAVLVADIKAGRERSTLGKVGAQLNHVFSGARSLMVGAGRRVNSLEAPYKATFLEMDPAWGDPRFWSILKSVSAGATPIHYLNAVDHTIGADGAMIAQRTELQIHGKIFWRTLWISALITVICLLLAYPVAYLLAALPLRISNLLMICVLLPFWTALLVRITAWIAILQSDGVILSSLASFGFVEMETSKRPQLVYNLFGTVVAMVHVLLPSMILPIYSVMKTIPPTYTRAARSLGASSFTAFTRVYFPQTLPGIAAGVLLVFILAVGYYITPALLGGSSGVLISNFIALHMESTLNWSLAAALGGLLLGATLILYWLFNKLVGIDGLKMG